ncbi:hypothetical protein ACJX0J_009448, partial [Zea mays]
SNPVPFILGAGLGFVWQLRLLLINTFILPSSMLFAFVSILDMNRREEEDEELKEILEGHENNCFSQSFVCLYMMNLIQAASMQRISPRSTTNNILLPILAYFRLSPTHILYFLIIFGFIWSVYLMQILSRFTTFPYFYICSSLQTKFTQRAKGLIFLIIFTKSFHYLSLFFFILVDAYDVAVTHNCSILLWATLYLPILLWMAHEGLIFSLTHLQAHLNNHLFFIKVITICFCFLEPVVTLFYFKLQYEY